MYLTKFDLEGRTAIVTGGGSWIGKGICLALAQAGANIVVVNRSANTAEATAHEVQEIGRKSLAIPTDVCDYDQVQQMVNKTVEIFGAIDILVNNAGGTTQDTEVPILEMSERIWDKVVDLNLKSVFLCSQAVAKVMIQNKKGNIVNISSWFASMPCPQCAPYASSKAGVINLTQTLAYNLAPYNIRVNAISPGSIPKEDIYKKNGRLGRWGTPEDIAWPVVFMASDASAFVTGQVLTVDGAVPAPLNL